MSKESLKILVPSGMMGYGFPIEDFNRGVAMKPDLISCDAGSTDSGPQKLGLGMTTCPRQAYVNEIEIVLGAARSLDIPLYISSAGGDGTNQHVDMFYEIVTELAKKHGWKLKIALLYAEIDKNLVKQKLREGKISPCGPVHELTNEEIDLATVIVAQMGIEPWLKAFKEHPDINVVISGRAYDPVPMVAHAVKEGFDLSLAWHLGKTIECGGKCAEPTSRSVFAELKKDCFELTPVGLHQRCTPYSVAAHTLYEKSHPYLLPGPGGVIDVSHAKFEQISEKTVRVSGSRFIPSEHYTVKLEGAKVDGFRAICICGIRDAILIEQIDDFLRRVEEQIQTLPPEILKDSKSVFHVYGKNGVMGPNEPNPEFVPQELCVIFEAEAPTQEAAMMIAARARVRILHLDYPGMMGTSGNAGHPFTPLEIPLGQVCEFNIYHLMEIDDPVELFPIKYMEVE